MTEQCQIRWMIGMDYAEVVAIDAQCFEFPWDKGDFIQCLGARNCIGMVAERHGRVVGYMIYELQKSAIHVLNFAVDPLEQRTGVGRQMGHKLINKLSQQRRQELVLEVRESNLAAQMFFRAGGFEATGVLRGHYENTDEDAYQFRYVLPECETVERGLGPPMERIP